MISLADHFMNIKKLTDRIKMAALLKKNKKPPTTTILKRRKIYIVPSYQGVLLSLCLLMLFIGATNYGLNFGFILLFFLISISVISLVETFQNLFQLELTFEMYEPCFQGDQVKLNFLVKNNSVRPKNDLLFNIEQENKGVTIHLEPFNHQYLQLTFQAKQRGLNHIPRIMVSTHYPIGVAFGWGYFNLNESILAYPKPVNNPPAIPLNAHASSNSIISIHSDNDFHGLRKKQVTDPPQHIAWKQVARRDQSLPLLTKEFSEGLSECYYFDFESTDSSTDTEKRLSILTSWVLKSHQENIPWCLSLPSASTNIGLGDKHLKKSLRLLALFGLPNGNKI